MRSFRAMSVAILALTCGGCAIDQTRTMSEACQQLLMTRDPSGTESFLRNAERRLEDLARPTSWLGKRLRELQDPDALEYKPALEQCVWRLKSLQR